MRRSTVPCDCIRSMASCLESFDVAKTRATPSSRCGAAGTMVLPILVGVFVGLLIDWGRANLSVTTEFEFLEGACESLEFSCISQVGCILTIGNNALQEASDDNSIPADHVGKTTANANMNVFGNRSIINLFPGETIPLRLCSGVQEFVDVSSASTVLIPRISYSGGAAGLRAQVSRSSEFDIYTNDGQVSTLQCCSSGIVISQMRSAWVLSHPQIDSVLHTILSGKDKNKNNPYVGNVIKYKADENSYFVQGDLSLPFNLSQFFLSTKLDGYVYVLPANGIISLGNDLSTWSTFYAISCGALSENGLLVAVTIDSRSGLHDYFTLRYSSHFSWCGTAWGPPNSNMSAFFAPSMDGTTTVLNFRVNESSARTIHHLHLPGQGPGSINSLPTQRAVYDLHAGFFCFWQNDTSIAVVDIDTWTYATSVPSALAPAVVASQEGGGIFWIDKHLTLYILRWTGSSSKVAVHISTQLFASPQYAIQPGVAVSLVAPSDSEILLIAAVDRYSSYTAPAYGGSIAMIVSTNRSLTVPKIGQIRLPGSAKLYDLPLMGLSLSGSSITFQRTVMSEFDILGHLSSTNIDLSITSTESAPFSTWPCPQAEKNFTACVRVNLSRQTTTVSKKFPLAITAIVGLVSSVGSVFVSFLRCSIALSTKKRDRSPLAVELSTSFEENFESMETN